MSRRPVCPACDLTDAMAPMVEAAPAAALSVEPVDEPFGSVGAPS